MALHWLLAVLIALNYLGAWEAEDLPKAEKAWAMAGHKAFGIIILTMTVLRIIWRLVHRAPPMLDSLRAWEAALARVVHGLAYFTMLAVPLAGWALHSAFQPGQGVNIFGFFTVPALPVSGSKPVVGLFHELHETFATLLLGLIVLHVIAALKHHFVDRDGTMRRMVPWG